MRRGSRAGVAGVVGGRGGRGPVPRGAQVTRRNDAATPPLVASDRPNSSTNRLNSIPSFHCCFVQRVLTSLSTSKGILLLLEHYTYFSPPLVIYNP